MTMMSQEGIAELCELVAIPSYPGDGHARRDAASYCAELLKREGFRTVLAGPDKAPSVIASIDGASDDRLLFYSHYDVVAPGDLSAWEGDPFTVREKAGCLFARGISDHKATFIARLVAVRRLVARGELPVGITFLVEGEEEMGSPSLEQILIENADLLRASGGLYSGGARDEEGRQVIRAGGKGRCELELSVRYGRKDNHSKWAALLPSAAWQLIAALGTLYDPIADRVLVEGLDARVVKPTARDQEALHTLAFDRQTFLENVGYERFRQSAADDPIKAMIFSPTFNLAWLSAGPGGGTVLPGMASAKLDIRLVPNQTPDEIATLITSHLRARGFHDVTITARGGSEPDRSDLDDPIVRAMRHACATFDDPVAVHPLAAGSGPRYLFRRHLGYSLIQDPGCSWQGSNDHAAEENIILSHFLDNCALIERFLRKYGELRQRQATEGR
jgi:acetylornithine deacetylase/succinyl-diaminopimelate desuccinylase-like protein